MAAKTPWVWEGQRYRDTKTGRFIGPAQMVARRDEFTDALRAQTAELSGRLAGQEITSAQWTLEMRQTIKTAYIDQYALGRGGRNMLTQRDYGIIGAQVKEQYKFLQGFERDILAGKLKPGQITMRAGMYVEGATQAFERARSESMGVPKLPQYPGDGATQCLSNCRCHWEIVPREGGWNCFWRLGPVRTEHCPDCAVNAANWNPLEVARA